MPTSLGSLFIFATFWANITTYGTKLHICFTTYYALFWICFLILVAKCFADQQQEEKASAELAEPLSFYVLWKVTALIMLGT